MLDPETRRAGCSVCREATQGSRHHIFRHLIGQWKRCKVRGRLDLCWVKGSKGGSRFRGFRAKASMEQSIASLSVEPLACKTDCQFATLLVLQGRPDPSAKLVAVVPQATALPFSPAPKTVNGVGSRSTAVSTASPRGRPQDAVGQHQQLSPSFQIIVVCCGRQRPVQGLPPQKASCSRNVAQRADASRLDLVQGRQVLGVAGRPGWASGPKSSSGSGLASGVDALPRRDAEPTNRTSLATVVLEPLCRHCALKCAGQVGIDVGEERGLARPPRSPRRIRAGATCHGAVETTSGPSPVNSHGIRRG